MKKYRLWGVFVLFMVLSPSLAVSQTPLESSATIAGSSLKWVHIAEPVFKKNGLDLDHYIIHVDVLRDTIAVSLKSVDSIEGCKGSCGPYDDFVVEINKKDMKVVRSYWQR